MWKLISKNFIPLSNNWFKFSNSKLKSDKFEDSDNGSKYYIGNKDGDIIRPLCIVLPQMSGYIKYFDNSEKKYFR